MVADYRGVPSDCGRTGEINLGLLVAAFGADAGGSVLRPGASPSGGVFGVDDPGGVDDLGGVDAEEVEVAAGSGAVVVSGGGEQVDAAVGVATLSPGPGMLHTMMRPTVGLHPGGGGGASAGGVGMTERGVVVEVGAPRGSVAVQPLAHATENPNPGVQHGGGPVGVSRLGQGSRINDRAVSGRRGVSGFGLAVGLAAVHLDVVGDSDGLRITAVGEVAGVLGVDEAVAVEVAGFLVLRAGWTPAR